MLHSHAYLWEVHPVVVDPARHGQGNIGRALMLDLERQVRQRGGLTLMLGTDDEVGLTSFSGIDLYADIPAAIANATASPPASARLLPPPRLHAHWHHPGMQRAR